MVKRKIVNIDEKKCNGCGECVSGCLEGAIQVIGHKAKLTGDSFCEGLGACVVRCPQGAISLEEREASAYSEKKVNTGSRLSQWPVQLSLVPADAPYFKGAGILISADCVPFAYADFHRDLLEGKVLLAGCPKLDSLRPHQEKLVEIFRNNNIKNITYARMEVPCCFGLFPVIKEALRRSGKEILLEEVIISVKGEKIK